MSRFEIEFSSDKGICVELICLECGNKFPTELDLNFEDESLPYSNSDLLYCLDCEVPYEYKIKFDQNKLEITFEVDLMKSGDLSVRMVDVNGRIIRTLESDGLEAGRHAMVWDARNEEGTPQAAGIYYAQIRVNGQMKVMKVVLQR